MKRIIIHIGIHKTGSTSIQQSFSDHHHTLKQLGYYFPLFKNSYKQNTESNHGSLFTNLYDVNPFKWSNNRRIGIDTVEKVKVLQASYLSQLAAVLKEEVPAIIFSAEKLSKFPLEGINKFKKDIETLTEGAVEFKIICCLREPVSYWQSLCQENIKIGVISLDEICKNTPQKPNLFQDVLTKYITAFGKDAVDVYRFEDMLVSKQGPFNYFLGRISADLQGKYEENWSNLGYCHEAIELISYMNEKVPTMINKKVNPHRKMNEHKILSQLQGVKFSLSEEVQTKIISESQNDRRWLKANYNLEYPNPEIKPVQKEKLWQESTINQLYGLMPKFNNSISSLIIKAMENIAISYKNTEPKKYALLIRKQHLSPLIIWTFRRTGGTNLAHTLFSSMDNANAHYEPFNKNRIYGYVVKNWKESKNKEQLKNALIDILSQKVCIKHCLENVPDEVNAILLEISVQYGYKHLFLYREQAEGRLLSLNYAEKTGVWSSDFKNKSNLDNSIFSQKIESKRLIQHELTCRKQMKSIYQKSVSLKAFPLTVSFENLYKQPYKQSKKLVQDLFTLLVPSMTDIPEEFFEKLLKKGAQGTKTDYTRFNGSEDFLKQVRALDQLHLCLVPNYQLDKTKEINDFKHFEIINILPGIERNSFHCSGIAVDKNGQSVDLLLKQGTGSILVDTSLEGGHFLSNAWIAKGRNELWMKNNGHNDVLLAVLTFQKNEIVHEVKKSKNNQLKRLYFFWETRLKDLTKNILKPKTQLKQVAFTPPSPFKKISVINNKIGYTPIPKIASTSIKHALYKLENKKAFSIEEHNTHIHNFFNEKKKAENNPLPDFNFIVIRDPIKRFLSGYANRVMMHKELSKNFIQNTCPSLEGQIPFFDPKLNQFIENLPLYLKVDTIQHHFQPMCTLLSKTESLKQFDKVYPLENIYSLEKDLSNMTGENVTLPNMQNSAPVISIGALSKQSIEVLLEYYRDDYEVLNEYYSVDQVWKEWKAICSAKGICVMNNKVGYFPIPKVACTSIKNALYELEFKKGFSEEQEGMHIHDAFNNNQNLALCDFNFIVIRDPIKRFLSAYSNRVLFHEELSESTIQDIHPSLKGEIPYFDPTITQFIENLPIYLKVLPIQHHVQPISEIFDKARSLEQFDKIYPLESLSALEDDLSIMAGRNVRFKHSQTGGPKISLGNLNRKQMENLLEYYRKDYELLNEYYPVEQIWQEWESSNPDITDKNGCYIYSNKTSVKTAKLVLKYLVENFTINSITHFGCRKTAWLIACSDLGILRCLGLYEHEDKLEGVKIETLELRPINLTENLHEHFDLVISLQLVENLNPAHSEQCIKSLCHSSNIILFGSTYLTEATKPNCQKHSYWATLFAVHGYVVFDLFRPMLHRHDEKGESWYKDNLFLYVKQDSTQYHTLIEQGFNPMENISFMDSPHPLSFTQINS